MNRDSQSIKMKFVFIGIIVFIPMLSFEQTKGIKFMSHLTWNEIKSIAVSENKYIFMDCYTTWCGPCKYMNQNIFSQEEVGDYFNKRFINVAMQMDENMPDSILHQQWYKDAKAIEKEYSVSAYPTYLFFSPDGQVVHRIVGVVREGKDFIDKATDAFKANKQYYSLISDYKKYRGDSAILRNFIRVAIEASDYASVSLIGNCYIECLKNPYSKENLELICTITKSTKDKGFILFYKHEEKINEIIGVKDYAESLIRNVISEENIYPIYISTIDWKEITKKLKKKFPSYADRVIAESKIGYYSNKKQWSEYEEAILHYMGSYGDKISTFDINENAWNVFRISNNQKILLEALKWSKGTISSAYDGQSPYIDTYANLLYKTGDRENAIVWEKKAIQAAIDQGDLKNKKIFEITLEKMQKGEKTWK